MGGNGESKMKVTQWSFSQLIGISVTDADPTVIENVLTAKCGKDDFDPDVLIEHRDQRVFGLTPMWRAWGVSDGSRREPSETEVAKFIEALEATMA